MAMEWDTENLGQYATDSAPCGCRFGTTPDARFIIIPCALDCPVYQYALDETARQGKGAEMRWTP